MPSFGLHGRSIPRGRQDPETEQSGLIARLALIVQLDPIGLKPVARYPKAATGHRCAIGQEIFARTLLDHVGLEPHNPLVLRGGRQDLGP